MVLAMNRYRTPVRWINLALIAALLAACALLSLSCSKKTPESTDDPNPFKVVQDSSSGPPPEPDTITTTQVEKPYISPPSPDPVQEPAPQPVTIPPHDPKRQQAQTELQVAEKHLASAPDSRQKQQAVELCQQASKDYREERYASVIGLAGRVDRLLQEYVKEVEDDLRKAERLVAGAPDFNKHKPEASQELAQARDHFQAGRYKQVEGIAGRVGTILTEKDPDDPTVRAAYEAGMALAGQGRWEDAVAKFKSIERPASKVEAERYYVPAQCQLGLYHQDRNLFDLAARHYENALQMKPVNPVAICNLAYCYYMLSRFEEALQQYRLVETYSNRIDPQDYDDITHRQKYFSAHSLKRLAETCADPAKQQQYRFKAYLAFEDYLNRYREKANLRDFVESAQACSTNLAP